jgi:hypothetical protein
MKLVVSYRKPEIVFRVDGEGAREAGLSLYANVIADACGTHHSWSFIDGVFLMRVRPAVTDHVDPTFDAAVTQPWLSAFAAAWPGAEIAFVAD